MAFADHVAAVDRAAQVHLGGVAVTYAPSVGAPVVVQGIFDEDYKLFNPTTGGVESIGPSVWLRLEDLPSHPNEDDPVVTISGKDYEVRTRETDGPTGGSVLLQLKVTT